MSDQQKTTTVYSRESISSMQITNLLNVFSITSAFIVNRSYAEERASGGAQDGGTLAAVEATLINVCSKLDEVIAETGRFNMGKQLELEKHLSDCYAQNTRMLAAQAEAYEEINTPHHRYKPALVKIAPGSWIAYCGNPTDLDNALVGAGSFPEQAIIAFDALFRGEIPAHLQSWLDANAAASEAGTQPPEFPKSEQIKNETNTLDQKRPDDIKKAPRKRGVRKPDSETDGPKP